MVIAVCQIHIVMVNRLKGILQKNRWDGACKLDYKPYFKCAKSVLFQINIWNIWII